MQDNLVKVLGKIEKIKNFWGMFHLSIPVRITVAKTYMLSQVCYVEPNDDTIVHIEEIISNFVTYQNNFAESQVFLPIKEGRMGLFKIKDFFRWAESRDLQKNP